MNQRIGYARVSTDYQLLDLQRAALQQRLQEKTSNETLFSIRWQVT